MTDVQAMSVLAVAAVSLAITIRRLKMCPRREAGPGRTPQSGAGAASDHPSGAVD